MQRLTKEEEEKLDVKYEQYKKFTVIGIGNDNDDIKLVFKKASQAVNCLSQHVKVGCVKGKHWDGSSKLISEKKEAV